jgi:hypothetical protein
MKMKHILITALCCLILALACKKDGSQEDVRNFGKVTIDSISPPKSASDAYIKVYGKNFPYQESEIGVTLNNTVLTVVDVNKDTILLYIPAGTTSGELRFVFDRTDPDSNHDYSDLLGSVITMPYTIDESLKAVPVIQSYTPNKGSQGATVTLTGYNIATTAGAVKVKFGNVEGALVSVNNTTIVVTVPNAAPGIVPLTVVQDNHTVATGDFEILEIPPVLLAVYFSSEGNKIMKGTFSNHAAPVVATLFDNSADGEDGVSGISTPANNASQDDFIYWGYQGINASLMRREYFIKKGATDKSQPLFNVFPATGATGNYIRDMDVRGGTVYYIRVSGPNPDANYIVSSPVTGGTHTDLYELPNDPEVWGLKGSADNTNTSIWWVEQKTKSVIRGSSTGAATVTLFDASDGLIFPKNIALDEAHGKIYVLDVDASNKPRILVGNLDGSGTLSVLPVPAASFGSYLYDIEIDTKNGYLYWITAGADASFMRCNIDGTNVQAILEHLKDPGGYFDILLP